MLDFKKKNRIRKILYSPFVLVLLFIILLLMISSVVGVYKKSELSSSNLERENIELNKLGTREKTLISSINYLKTEYGIENEIRTKFRAVKDGEKIAIIIDDSVPTNEVIATSTSFWDKVFYWFK